MKTQFLVWASIAALLHGAGCEESSPPQTAQRVAAPSGSFSEVATDAAPQQSDTSTPQPGAPQQRDLSPEAASPAPAAGGGLLRQAFLAAHRRVMTISNELLTTLDGVTDEAAARAAAPKISELTSQWKTAAEIATAAFLALPDDQQDASMMEAVQSSMAELTNLSVEHGADISSQIQRIAKSPAGPILQNELIAFRDAFLTTRGPYSPVLARRKLEEQLGPVGSPLKTD